MITKAVLENFKSHKKTTLNFVPGVNVIIGLTDQGKSAAFQAMNWVISNRPLGDDYRSEWGGETKVELHTSEGDVVGRRRTATKNEYMVNGKVLTAFGAEVPEEVTRLLRIEPENVQAQFDKYFLLADTPGEAARELNRAASIDDIDHTTAGLRSSYSKLDNDIKSDKKELEKLQAQLAQFDNIPMLEEKLAWIEMEEIAIRAGQEKLVRMKGLVGKIKRVDSELSKTGNLPTLLSKLDQVQKQHDSFSKRSDSLSKMKGLVSRIKQVDNELNGLESLPDLLLKLEKAQERWELIYKKHYNLSKLKSITAQVKDADEGIAETGKEIEKLTQEFNRLSPETCPLCNSPMKEVV